MCIATEIREKGALQTLQSSISLDYFYKKINVEYGWIPNLAALIHIFFCFLCQTTQHVRNWLEFSLLRLRFSSRSLKAFPDCSALIKSGFFFSFNRSIIWQHHHSRNLKTLSEQWILLYLHAWWYPTERVRRDRMSLNVSSHSPNCHRVDMR